MTDVAVTNPKAGMSMFFIVRKGSFALCFSANPDDHRKASWLEKPAFDEPSLGDFCVCIPMFTVCFHVQLAAKQH
jgi:hypothetical protein